MPPVRKNGCGKPTPQPKNAHVPRKTAGYDHAQSRELHRFPAKGTTNRAVIAARYNVVPQFSRKTGSSSQLPSLLLSAGKSRRACRLMVSYHTPCRKATLMHPYRVIFGPDRPAQLEVAQNFPYFLPRNLKLIDIFLTICYAVIGKKVTRCAE